MIEMATGRPPWSHFGSQISALFHIASAKTPPPLPDGLTELGRDFLSRMLRRAARERPKAAQLLQHGWLFAPDETMKEGRGPIQQLIRPAVEPSGPLLMSSESAARLLHGASLPGDSGLHLKCRTALIIGPNGSRSAGAQPIYRKVAHVPVLGSCPGGFALASSAPTLKLAIQQPMGGQQAGGNFGNFGRAAHGTIDGKGGTVRMATHRTGVFIALAHAQGGPPSRPAVEGGSRPTRREVSIHQGAGAGLPTAILASASEESAVETFGGRSASDSNAVESRSADYYSYYSCCIFLHIIRIIHIVYFLHIIHIYNNNSSN